MTISYRNSQTRLSISRRTFLTGLSAAGVSGALLTVGTQVFLNSDTAAQDSVPFKGLHQAGILTPQPAAALMVAFDVTALTKADLMKMFQTLSQRIEFLMAGGTPPTLDPRFPPPDSGILGSVVVPDSLTVTVAVGASLFDSRFGLSALKPKYLTEMPGFPNDELDLSLCNGDLLLQFCANHAETNLHALRDIVKNLANAVVLRWKMEGFIEPNKLKGQHRTSVRNLLGFKDGTANLDTKDDGLMNRVVWVQPKSEEPPWTAGGSYQVVRIIRNRVERWDRTPLQEQEAIIGRDKYTGAPLGDRHESDIPDYRRDPLGKQIPRNAHIRLANPRKSELGLILRRGFNYSLGVDKSGQLNMGLLFVCFQSNLEKGFITVQNRLNGEPLEEYIKPIGGGYFFALPGVQEQDGYLGRSLLESAS